MASSADVFQFFYKSADAAPGKGAGEKVSDSKAYKDLAGIKGWRKILSNFAETPFEWKGLHWKTVEHAFQAAKFETLDPTLFQKFSLDSGDAIGQGPGDIARSHRKAIVLNAKQQKEWAEKRDSVLTELWTQKFTMNPEAKRVLLLTHPAQLWHQAPRSEKEHWTDLELLREALLELEKEQEAQRNEAPQAEMADAGGAGAASPKPAKKKGGRPKKAAATAAGGEEAGGAAAAAAAVAAAAAAPAPVALPEAVVADEAALALAGAGPLGPPEGLDAPEEKQSAVRFCPVCRYYLYLQANPRGAEEENQNDVTLTRLCRNCGFKEEDTKGGLVMEMYIQERAAESYKILLNEFTRRDPRLPHIQGTIKCPDPACESNHGATKSDILYIKYDPINMLYVYICDICGHTWRSRRS